MWGTQCVEDEKTPCTVWYLGEFGEVYKAHLIIDKWHSMEMPRVVAVKTLKGSVMVLRFVLYKNCHTHHMLRTI